MDHVELTLPRQASSVAAARAALRPLRDELGDRHGDAVLLVSELVTNAVRHGSGPEVRLTGTVRAGRCRFEIVDGGDGFVPPPAAEMQREEAGSRGLPIVEALADAWGVYEGSTHVWFEIDL